MATYKFNAVQRYGKFHGALYKASDPQKDPLQHPAQDSAASLSAFLNAQISELGVDEDSDTIIFRNNSYNDFAALEKAVRLATY